MKKIIGALAFGLAVCPAFAAGKSCDELKSEITAKIEAKGVKNYQLDVVAADQVDAAPKEGEQVIKVVGSCEGGAKKITYVRN